MRIRSTFASTHGLSTGAWLVLGLAGSAAGQVTGRMSVDSGEVEGNLESRHAVTSADGRYVAFESRADNLVPGDGNSAYDVFVRDRWLGTTERVSVDSAGAPTNSASSGRPSISDDGRYVAFYSGANNLVAGDTNNSSDVFVRDRQLGLTERVSIDSAGVQGNDASGFHASSAYYPYLSISADGRYVAFWSNATNLVAGDTNGAWDIFLHDRHLDTTERVSVSTSGTQGNNDCYSVRVSADGRYVAFDSFASNLVGGDTNGRTDIFVRDRQLGLTERVNFSSGGAEADGNCYVPSISTDGRYVAFHSDSSNLVPGDTNNTEDVFIRDRQTGTTELVSADSGEVLGNGRSAYPGGATMSPDGRYVTFNSRASNLVTGDSNGSSDIFLRDRQLGTTERVSVDSSGTEGNNESWTPALSPDGRWVVFESHASNLVSGDTNAFLDIFVNDRDATGFKSLCDPGVGGVIPCPCSNPPAGTGRGCNNFGTGPVDSGTLTATGIAYLSQDTLDLHATGENNTSLTVFWTGTTLIAPPGVAQGAGVRCVTGLKRLYTGSASGGAISEPSGANPSVSVRSAAVGAPISAGNTRYYFTIYRDPNAAGPCGSTSSTVNVTNTGAITWNL